VRFLILLFLNVALFFALGAGGQWLRLEVFDILVDVHTLIPLDHYEELLGMGPDLGA
jgi:hypothetical protein